MNEKVNKDSAAYSIKQRENWTSPVTIKSYKSHHESQSQARDTSPPRSEFSSENGYARENARPPRISSAKRAVHERSPHIASLSRRAHSSTDLTNAAEIVRNGLVAAIDTNDLDSSCTNLNPPDWDGAMFQKKRFSVPDIAFAQAASKFPTIPSPKKSQTAPLPGSRSPPESKSPPGSKPPTGRTLPHEDITPLPKAEAPFTFTAKPKLSALNPPTKNTSAPRNVDMRKFTRFQQLNQVYAAKKTNGVSPPLSPTISAKKPRSTSINPPHKKSSRKSKRQQPGRHSLTSEEVLKIIGSNTFNSQKGQRGTPLQDLVNDLITDNEFAAAVDRQSPEMRRHSIKELATQFKRLLTLLAFTSSIASELNLETAMEQITEQICEILKCDRATLFIIDDQSKLLWSRVRKGNVGELRIPIGKGIASRVAVTGEGVNVANAYQDSTFYSEIDSITGYKTKSVLCLPVKGDNGKPIAVLQALNKQGGAQFTDEDELILKTICLQTAITLRNSQMYTSSLFQQHKIQVLLEVANQLASELEINSLITTIMAKTRELLDADRCTLFLLDHEKEQLWSKVADGTAEIRIPMRMGIAGHVAVTGETLNIHDAYNDSRFNKEIDLKTGYRTRSILCMPMRNNQGEVIGVTQVLNKRDGVFDKEDEDLLNAFSAQAAVAIENSKLFQKTREMSNYLQSILKSITNLVMTLDEEGKMITSNRNLEPIIGYPEKLMKTTSYKLWLGAYNPQFAQDIARVYSEPQEAGNADYEFTKVVNGTKSVMSMKYTVVPLLDYSNTQRGVVIIIEDITPQKRMMSTLSRYMSPAVAEQVIKEGGNRLGGVHVTVTTLFIDIRNFTAMSETMDAAEVVDMLNEYFGYMVNAVFEENGVLDKYIGDAVMAVFGVPFAAKDDAARACRAALKMLSYLKKLNAVRQSQGKWLISVGIGINTGRVLSGNIGSEKRLEYTVIGDGVNLASRIEGVTKKYGLKTIISEFTKDDVGDQFRTREVDSITVVGKQQPIKIYELLGTADTVLEPNIEQMLPIYANALAAYRGRQWNTASELFQQCVQLTGDKPSQMFIQRCKELAENPPPPDWNGVAVMLEK